MAKPYLTVTPGSLDYGLLNFHVLKKVRTPTKHTLSRERLANFAPSLPFLILHSLVNATRERERLVKIELRELNTLSLSSLSLSIHGDKAKDSIPHRCRRHDLA